MDILVYIDEDPATEQRCHVALELGRVCGSFIHCLQVTSPNALIASGSFGSARMLAERAEEVEQHKDALRASTRHRFETAQASWQYRCFDGDPAQTIVEQSRLIDLIVLSAERQQSRLNTVAPSAADVLLRTRVPVMAVPARMETFTASGSVLIAWDGSPECTHALRSALTMLKCASGVVVATVGGENHGIRGDQVGAYLARHGIRAEFYDLPRSDRSVGGVLVDAARIYRASYVVMGAFGHGRTREFLLGGVTRDMLRSSPVPLVLAH